MYSSTSSTHHTTHTHTPRTCRPQSVLCGARRARRRPQGAYGHAARIQPGRYHRRRCRPTPRAPPSLRSRRRPQLPVRVLQCRHGRTALPRPHRIHRSGAAGHMPGENLTEKNLPTTDIYVSATESKPMGGHRDIGLPQEVHKKR